MSHDWSDAFGRPWMTGSGEDFHELHLLIV
jgi:hypothetical protein